MKIRFIPQWRHARHVAWLLAALGAVAAGLAVADHWRPDIRRRLTSALASWGGDRHAGEACADADHADHDHERAPAAPCSSGFAHDHGGEAPGAHAGEEDGHAASDHEPDAGGHEHDEAAAVKLSAAAQDNVGLKLAKVELRPFERTVSIPAMVVERPGRSAVQVAAPLTGVVTRIWPLQGETVTPGQALFDLRLTHEEVVEAQAEFLRTAEEIDVLRSEIARLEKVAADGAVAGKTLLERTYERQKLEAVFRAQRQRLLLHGLSPEQVDGIVARRTLLSELTVFVPDLAEGPAKAEAAGGASSPLLQVEQLHVVKGQHVRAGDPLCVLADHGRLYIQGRAFEQDAAVLERAANSDWRVTAAIEAGGRERLMVTDLPIVSLANRIDPQSRAFLFHVELPNQLVRDRPGPEGHRFSSWRFRPGQRVDLLVPVERWAARIVLPLAAVVQDGAESYVFEKNDGHFDRRAVRVEYRDQYSAVIANDGALTPGKMVIVAGAYQVHLAMKNKAGGAPDPHAGHNH